MAELTVATWNAENAFGDQTHDRYRFNDAMAFIQHMDPDLLAIPETACRGVHPEEQDQERLQLMSDIMARRGYEGFITNNTDRPGLRDAHYLSLWTRVGHGHRFGPNDATQEFGERKGLFLHVPSLNLDVYAGHLSDAFPDKRIRTMTEMRGHMLRRAEAGREQIVLLDGNEMHADDPRARLPRFAGKLIGKLEFDYYDTSKPFRRLLGKAVRISRMGDGEALRTLTGIGFHDADPAYQPTIGRGHLAYKLDHILGSIGISFTNTQILRPSATPNSELLADHWAVRSTAVIER